MSEIAEEPQLTDEQIRKQIQARAEEHDKKFALRFTLMKEYIQYDKIVDNLIASKKRDIIKCKLDIEDYTARISTLENDIIRITEERDNGKFNSNYIFVNPYTIYDNMCKTK